MANKKRKQLVEHHGFGVSVLNPNFGTNKFNPDRDSKWISSGCHRTMHEARLHANRHFSGKKVHFYGIRLKKHVFDEETEKMLAKLNFRMSSKQENDHNK